MERVAGLNGVSPRPPAMARGTYRRSHPPRQTVPDGHRDPWRGASPPKSTGPPDPWRETVSHQTDAPPRASRTDGTAAGLVARHSEPSDRRSTKAHEDDVTGLPKEQTAA